MFNLNSNNPTKQEKPAKSNRTDAQVEGKVAVIGNAVDRIVTVTGRAVITYFIVGAVQNLLAQKSKK